MLPILSIEEIRQADAYTIEHEPIPSIDLMERASRAFCKTFQARYHRYRPVTIFCGQGNNGGDGLAIARLLKGMEYKVRVYVLKLKEQGSADFGTNLDRLQKLGQPYTSLTSEQDLTELHNFAGDEILVDALLGTGLSKPLKGVPLTLVKLLNQFRQSKVAVDIPTGLFGDKLSNGEVFRADHTITFQFPKRSFLFAETEPYVGEIEVVDIQLAKDFVRSLRKQEALVEEADMQLWHKDRKKHGHKGTYGHALLSGGSYGKLGAVQLAAKAALRSGLGLLTVHVPACGYEVLQGQVPEAMLLCDQGEKECSHVPYDPEQHTTMCLGMGWGKTESVEAALEALLKQGLDRPFVLDADALNLLAERKDLWPLIPRESILTPHPKEFDRWAGPCATSMERLGQAKGLAQEQGWVLVLKGGITAVCLPSGQAYGVDTGNPGMATGGMGDALAGVITGLLAQGYNPTQAAVMGVYLHGRAGTLALDKQSHESLLPSDLIEHLGLAFQELRPKSYL